MLSLGEAYLVLQTGCTAIYIPGWAAIGAMIVATAPRVAGRIFEERPG